MYTIECYGMLPKAFSPMLLTQRYYHTFDCVEHQQTYLLNLNWHTCQMKANISKSSFPCMFIPLAVFKRITFALTHRSYQHFAYNSTLSLRFQSHKHHYSDAVRKQFFTRTMSFLLKIKQNKKIRPHFKACEALQKHDREVSFPAFFLFFHFLCSHLCCKLYIRLHRFAVLHRSIKT